MRRPDERDAALRDRAARARLGLGADLVDDDDLRHVVLDRLDHHVVLARRVRHLHAPRAADRRVRHVAVAADLVRRVDDHDAPPELLGQHARDLADRRRLADAGAAQKEHRRAGGEDVAHHLDVARHGAPDAARQADDGAAAVAQRADAVERAGDAGAVVAAEGADGGRGGLELGARHLVVGLLQWWRGGTGEGFV